MVKPLIAQLSSAALVVQNFEASSSATILYEVRAAPPLWAGVVQASDTVALPAVIKVIDGAPGTVFGVTAEEGADALVPWLLAAVTVNV